jgi:triosephosphate isomerase
LSNPIIVVNFKTYDSSIGKNAIKLAKIMDETSKESTHPLDNVVSSPTYNMKINSEAVASVAYTSETIRVYNDYTSSLVFDIILKL